LLASTGFEAHHPLNGFGYPMMKKANPRNGVVAVSSRLVNTNTPSMSGLKSVI
jgi:hypothetical protein